ncbi:TetR family transcriptional regulator [Devosia sp. XJ19-1]|uniref:TetR family transcriptional regulator n=1 Tax=Devosia ureilytica TaxID=2952754 RepID=A0A9Q4FU84_9HYPH|nr:TetR family transcriptional regulator [Devosia ureilytica]MCP8884784.1 TetR family transcriptional regulator [Devosia ureilytica]MCP8888415.1 TetR family transcriptional regulator [Devosia ureilytica]
MTKPSKRQDLVAAAIQLLAEGGSEALTAGALAARAGVSKANVFHHFPRLDEIVLEAFELFVMGMPSMQPQSGMDLRSWLQALGRETTASMDTEPDLAAAYFGFVAKARTDAQLNARLAEIAAAARRQFEASLDLLAPRRFAPEERAALAALILMTGDGLALHRHLFPDQAASQAAAWSGFVEMVCAGEVAT